VLIVQTYVASYALFGDGNGLLILLLYHVEIDAYEWIMVPEPKQSWQE
jgi:hypothetical protein